MYSVCASLQCAFVFTQLFLTLVTAHGTVTALIEIIRMTVVRNLPAKQQNHRKDASRKNQGTSQYHQGCANHNVIPVENTAGGTAAIVHHPGLERTEEQDANDVADTVESSKAHHKTSAQNALPVTKIEHSIQSQPG